MSCAPGMTEREQRMLRAFHHYAFATHELMPSTCAGCLEAMAFLTVLGYEGTRSTRPALRCTRVTTPTTATRAPD